MTRMVLQSRAHSQKSVDLIINGSIIAQREKGVIGSIFRVTVISQREQTQLKQKRSR